MRIISGKYKGLKIDSYNILGTRPTMDRIKESLFGTIQSYIKDSVCLDLFAGSGSLGLEALSNGASKVILIDNNVKIINLLNEFIIKHDIEDVNIIKSDYKEALLEFKKNNTKFDIIFLDPPYDLNLINKSITLIEEYDLLNIDGLIICEYTKENIKCNYELFKEKQYGDKNISIYKRTQ
jgi:16S rRNA (guanine966-N2)-methyltransferase